MGVSRYKQRRLLMQLFFADEVGQQDAPKRLADGEDTAEVAAILHKFCDSFQYAPDFAVDPGIQHLAARYYFDRRSIDEDITKALKTWNYDRLLAVDLALIRLALLEIKFTPAAKVALIVAAVLELADEYSTGESKKFINGILGVIINGVDPDHQR